MFKGFTQETVDFLWNIRLNNRKDWFSEHKDEYKKYLAEPMKELSNEVFSTFCEETRVNMVSSVCRIAKDARFPHAYPYRDNYWFTFKEKRDDWWILPAYYFELTCEGWSYGMGMWSASAAAMQKFRDAVDENPKAFEKLIKSFDRQNRFTLDGDFYKRAKGDISPAINNWYNRRSISCSSIHTYDDAAVFDSGIAELLRDDFRTLYPLCEFIHDAVNK